VNRSRVHEATEQSATTSFMNSPELPLLIFDENSDVSQAFHFRQPDEFIRLKWVSKAYQLTVAYRSIAGQMTKQWP
jgi:hypothetical protein